MDDMNPPAKFRARLSNDEIVEVELTEQQAATLMAGQPIGYFPHDERVRVEGLTLVRIESAIPLGDANSP